MSENYYFRFDSIHVDFVRSKDADSDWLYFAVTAGNQALTWKGQIGGEIHSGDTLFLNRVLGPLTVSDEDVVTISYTIVNLSHSSQEDQQKQTDKLFGDLDGVVFGIAAGAAGVTVAGAILAAVAGVMAGFSDILDALGLGGPPNCNGTVLQDSKGFSGVQLRDMTANGRLVLSNTYDQEHSPSECGHDPRTNVVVSVLRASQTTKVSGNPVLIQSRFGHQGNFELVAPLASGGLAHFFRNNDDPTLPWIGPIPFGANIKIQGPGQRVSLIQSNFGDPGNLEVVADASLFFRDSGPEFNWSGLVPIPIDIPVQAPTVLIQSRFGSKGNFELLIATSTFLPPREISHLFRNNDDPNLPWTRTAVIPIGPNSIDGITMIESNFGNPGNLEVVIQSGGALLFLFRDQNLQWQGPFPLEVDRAQVTGVTGNPVLVQSRFGHQGNFELIVPKATGGILYLIRDNDAPDLPWHFLPSFGESLGVVDAVTMIQSNFGDPGNMEVIAIKGGDLFFFFRDSGPDFHWSGPFQIIV